jgi:hypothetical protein
VECIHCGLGKFKIDSVDQNQPEEQEEITDEISEATINEISLTARLF